MNDQVSERLLNYKNTVASKYLPVRSDQISSRVFDLDKYYISTKIDGHICFILKDKNNITIVNHNSTAFEREELIKEIPLGRFGDPEEIAHLVSFICSEEASYITGQVIHINGGLYM